MTLISNTNNLCPDPFFRNRDAIREFGGVTNLCQLLETTNDEKVGL